MAYIVMASAESFPAVRGTLPSARRRTRLPVAMGRRRKKEGGVGADLREKEGGVGADGKKKAGSGADLREVLRALELARVDVYEVHREPPHQAPDLFFYFFLAAVGRNAEGPVGRSEGYLRTRRTPDLRDASLRSDLAPRRSPSACAEKWLKTGPTSFF